MEYPDYRNWTVKFPDGSMVVFIYEPVWEDDIDAPLDEDVHFYFFLPNIYHDFETTPKVSFAGFAKDLSVKREWECTTLPSNTRFLATWYPEENELRIRHNNTSTWGWSDEYIGKEFKWWGGITDDTDLLNIRATQ